ncbi:MAG: hypothetical protein AB8B64_04575 [Granulosicoccus sp.]
MNISLTYPQRFLSTGVGVFVIAVFFCTSAFGRSGGPSPDYNASVECAYGIHDEEHTVSEGDDGEYKQYNVIGTHRYDATNVVFDGIESDRDTLVHWPVAIKAADNVDRRIAHGEGQLTASTRGSVRHTYRVKISSGIDLAHFYVEFDKADRNSQFYMKLTDPNGKSKFYNRPTSAFESAIIRWPKKGWWKVGVAIKRNSGNTVRYAFNVDDDGTIDLDKIRGTLSGNSTAKAYRDHMVTIPAGLPKVHFFTQFSRVNPLNRPSMKLKDPSGEIFRHNTNANDYESAVVNNPAPGEWRVRVTRKKSTADDIDYRIEVSDDQRIPTAGCWTGGVIYGAWDENGYGVKRLSDTRRIKRNKVSWEAPYHQSGGITLEISNFLLEDISIVSHGDGIRSNGEDIVIDGAYVTDIHDDCVENDKLGTLLIKDSFFDGCYVAFSARSDFYETYDGSRNLFEIRDTLVRLEKQPTVFKPDKYGTAPGHGNFFKWSLDKNKAMKLAVHDSIFLVSAPSRHGDGLGLEEISHLESCSNNVIVWTGSGRFPNAEELPDCFRLTTNYSEWSSAVSAWRRRHPNRPSRP